MSAPRISSRWLSLVLIFVGLKMLLIDVYKLRIAASLAIIAIVF